jgi:acetyl-CoA synthetase
MEQIHTFNDYLNQYEQSKTHNSQYWEGVASNLDWFKKWDKASSGDFSSTNVKWFEGAQTNLAYNCLDRHLEENGDKNALIYVKNDPEQTPEYVTYKELHERVCRFANILKNHGIKKGDRVCFYMGMTPELMIGVLACARIGAVHSVVFGGFSAKALADRINDCEANILITNDWGVRGDKLIALKNVADEALEKCTTIKSVIVQKSADKKISMKDGRDFWFDAEMEKVSSDCPAVKQESEDPLFILYTSGSTGKPKGLLHTTGGYMTYAYHTFRNVFQVQENDIYWCTADIGWITGHTYITYGPLLNGATTVMFEGIPTWPDAGRFWQIVDQLKVTHFYTAPTAIRALEAKGLGFVSPYSLSSLKVLGSVGEPINEEAWDWYNKNIGKEKCPIVDTWWQTETGGIMISPLAGITETKPCYATLPLPGIFPALMDAEGREIESPEAEGNLCIKKPWPGIARTIYGDHERYKDTYFSTYPGYYFTGDGAKRESSGIIRITGRVDDVINVSGHRIGTAEVEDAINAHDLVVESAVIGYSHPIKGQGIFAFIIPSNDKEIGENFHQEINAKVAEMIGSIAKPEKIKVVSGLPKTRSGKIMRRILRKVAEGDFNNLGDTSTLLNPEIVDELIRK